MQRVAEQIQRLQGNDLTVLITGESGTGKDLVARAIHAGSPRSGNMFLPYNCTSATRELADSQLFGHRRGSFTGAVADQPGVLRTALGGTLFLDEIGDLPLDVQPKLLRFLEQGEILPVGDTRPQRVDVRVVAATNADLEQRVAEGKFREDLFYRLSVIRIHVPPLRERREEIPHLSTFFLREACERLGKPGVRLSAGDAGYLRRSPGPATSGSCGTRSSAPSRWRRRAAHQPGPALPGVRHDRPRSPTTARSRPWPAARPLRGRREARARDDPRRARARRRQYLGNRAPSGPHPAGALSEDGPPRRRRGSRLARLDAVCPRSPMPRSAYTSYPLNWPFDYLVVTSQTAVKRAIFRLTNCS